MISDQVFGDSKGQKASLCGVSCQLSKYAHKTTNDWSIILLNLHNNKKFRFTKGDWIEGIHVVCQ